MLQVLKVFNIALIEQAEIEFSAGFNVLTGETGAGKSIIIDALSVVLGGRSSVEMIRSGSEQFRVEAVFDLQQHPKVLEWLAEQAIPAEEDGLLFISRSVAKQGKNTVLLNGTHAPLSLLRVIGDMLLDMHGQHENQALLHPESYIDLLDGSDTQLATLFIRYHDSYEAWRRTTEKIAAVDKDDRQRAQRVDMLKWQAKEIEAAKLKDFEEEELQRQISLLTNAEKISASVGKAWSVLSDESSQEKGVIDILQECRKNLESSARFDDSLLPYAQQIADIVVQLEDVAPGLRDYLDQVEFDPLRLAQFQERMDLIYRLKQKYGLSVQEVIEYGRNAQKELGELERHDEILQELRALLTRQEHEMELHANKLHEKRMFAAIAMSHAIEAHLKDLGMPGGRFSIQVTYSEHYSSAGKDNVRFEFSANPGEELRLLSKVASGGELSRVALAIKTVCARNDGAQVMVFDEIDSGVGGHTARKVAEKIGQVASQKQVLCITHLPQIASMADCHIHIEKRVVDNRTQTFVKRLSTEERLVELARMIGGDPITKAGLDNAAEMMQTAATLKVAAQRKEG
ncbi:MAG TPA: DNA repair protein RecN [Negativicutes bacterium]|nr:DNA repair protein RecN [Negativicutes bacterium]